MKKLISLFLLLAMMGSLAAPAAAAESAEASTMRLESAEGTVTVKNASGLAVELKDKMRLYDGYTVKTAAKSYAYISLDGDKSLKLDASSEASVNKSGRKLEIALSSGSMFFNVSKPLASSESLNIRTSTMVTGVRGTSACVSAPSRNRTEITLLTGQLEVTGMDSHSGEISTTEMVAGERAVVSQQEVGTPQEHLEIQKVSAKEAELPGFAAVEVAKDPELQSRIAEETTLSVTQIVEEAEERLTAEQTAAQEKETEVQQQLEQQEQQPQAETVEPVFQGGESAPGSDPGDSGDSSDSGSSGSGQAPVTPSQPDPEPEPAPSPQPVTHTVTISGEHITPPTSTNPVEDGKSFLFTLTPDNGYAIDAVSYSAGAGTPATPLTPDANGKYSIPSVTSDLTVAVTTVSTTIELNTNDLEELKAKLADPNVETINLTATAGTNFAVGQTAGVNDHGFEIPANKTLNLASGNFTFYNVDMYGTVTTAGGTALTIGQYSGYYGYTNVESGGTLTVNGSLEVVSSGMLCNRGTLTLSETTIKDGGNISNDADMTLSNQTTCNGSLSNGGTLTIDPTGKLMVDISGSGSVSNDGTLNNEGRIEVTRGTLTVRKYPPTNPGDPVGEGTLNNNNGLTLNGGSLSIGEGSSSDSSGTLNNSGGLTLDGGTLTVMNGTLGNSGTLTVTGADSALTVDGDGAVLNNRSVLHVDSSGELFVTPDGVLSVNNGSTLTVDGTDSKLSNRGALTVLNGGNLEVNNNGELGNYGGGTATVHGTVKTENGGILNVDSGEVIFESGSELISRGNLTVTQYGKLTNKSNLFNNYGTMKVEGTLENSGILTFNTGSLTVGSGGTLNITGGSVGTDNYSNVQLSTEAADSTSGFAAGIVNLSGGTLRTAQITGGGTLKWTGGTIECMRGTGSTPVDGGVDLVPGSGSSVGTPTAISGQSGWYTWTLTPTP